MKTLTPLWTGGVNTGEMERLQEKGLIGSLRWWDEAILRGLGNRVCQPTSASAQERCSASEGRCCEVCQLYGATGLQRSFRLRVHDGEPIFSTEDFRSISLPSGRLYFNRNTGKKDRIGGWFLQGQAQMSEGLRLEVITLGDDRRIARIWLALALIERHAAIGAKVSNGYGVVAATERLAVLDLTTDFIDQLPPHKQAMPPVQQELPDLRDLFFAKLSFAEPKNKDWWKKIGGLVEAWNGSVAGVPIHNFKDQKKSKQALAQTQHTLQEMVGKHKVVPLAPAVRNWLRFEWASGLNYRQKNFLFGARTDEGMASKINVSHAYQTATGEWEFRVWGWLPSSLPDGLKRAQFLADLKTALSSKLMLVPLAERKYIKLDLKLAEWHELDENNRDGRGYLKKLLGLAQGGVA
jgi:CRISPR-associated protein Cmr1